MPAVAALALLLPALPASASTTHGWIQNAYTENVLAGSFPGTASYFFKPAGLVRDRDGLGQPDRGWLRDHARAAVRVGCQVATYAAAGDIVAVQDQADTTTPSAYRALFDAARSQALAAHAGVKVYTEVSGNYGTAAQAYTAATGVTFDGVFLNVANSDVSWENALLNKFKSGGY